MNMTVELNKEEMKKAIQIYLEQEKQMAVNSENISFNIKRSSAPPGQIGSPVVKSVSCADIDKLNT
jgi:hypothetical protein